jgi:hypothetical protein
MEAKDMVNQTEEHLIEFSVKRFVSPGLYIKLLGIMMNISNVSYPYVQSAKLNTQICMLYERVLSLLAGYPYPYTREQRPVELKHLDPYEVVRFLHLSMKKLSLATNEIMGRKKSKSDSTTKDDSDMSSQQEQYPQNTTSYGDFLISGDCLFYTKSPIVQLVIQDLVSEEKEKQKSIKSLVRSWYLLLCSTDTLAQQRDFSNALIKFLAENTYDQSASRRAAQAEASSLSQNLTAAMEVEKQLSLVINTLTGNMGTSPRRRER